MYLNYIIKIQQPIYVVSRIKDKISFLIEIIICDRHSSTTIFTMLHTKSKLFKVSQGKIETV